MDCSEPPFCICFVVSAKCIIELVTSSRGRKRGVDARCKKTMENNVMVVSEQMTR